VMLHRTSAQTHFTLPSNTCSHQSVTPTS